jgi:cytochrome P450
MWLENSNGSDLSLLDALTKEAVADPYPIYARIRREEPVLWDERLGCWVLTRYADVVAAAKDYRFSAARAGSVLGRLPGRLPSKIAALDRSISRQILFLDPPDHTRIRGQMQGAFAPRSVESMRPRIQGVVDGLLDRVAGQGRMEVVRELARSLPALVMAEILGVLPEDWARFQGWSRDYAVLVGGAEVPARQAARHATGVRAFLEYVRRLVDQRRWEPRDDLLQTLIEAEREGCVAEGELLANYAFIAAAGHLTTAGLITNGVYTLIRHPEARAALTVEPDLIAPALEEMLRTESPIQSSGRRAIEDLEIGGKRIQSGQFVRFHLGAANRDPAQFDRPDVFDLTRRDNRHIAFGQGAHYCLGAALGRLEGQIALGSILERFPDIRPAGEEPRWRMDIISRGLKSLSVSLN